MTYRSIVVGLLSIAICSPAIAQETPAPAAPTSANVFELNMLLIAPVQPLDPGLAGDAARVGALLQDRLATTNVTLAITDVPRFDAQDYTAETYVLACPPGKYSGCALVVGQRAPSDWVVGATLNHAPEDALSGSDDLILTVYFIDVKGSREVVNFGVVVGGDHDENEVIGGIAEVYDKIVQGALAEVDVRGEVLDPKLEAQLRSRRAEIAAASLLELESQLGELIITAPSEIEAERVTRASLKEYDNREDTAPWTRLDMTEGQYLRYRNTGLELQAYRRRIRGRFGQILLRATAGGGKGPFGLHHEGRKLVGFVDGSGFQDLQIDQFQELRQAANTGLSVELGFGVAPFAEVAFVIGNRSAAYTYVFDQDELDKPSLIDAPSSVRGSTLLFGAHTTFAPLPLRQFRPTATLGFMSWSGRSIPVDDPYKRLEAPNMVLLQVGPGAEVSAGRYLNLFVRALFDVPVAGNYVDARASGQTGLLEELQTPLGEYGPGFTVQGGFQIRVGVLKDPSDDVGNFFEEEEEGL